MSERVFERANHRHGESSETPTLDEQLASFSGTVSEVQWRSLVDRVLAGPRAEPGGADARFERLVTTTLDRLRIEPLYTATSPRSTPEPGWPGVAPFTRGTRPPGAARWDVRQRVVTTDDDEASARQVRDELERGATSIVVDLTRRTAIDADGLAAVLDGVQLDLMTLVLDAGERWPVAAEALVDVWSQRGREAGPAMLGADPLGGWAASGGATDVVVDTAEGARWAQRAADGFPQVVAIAVDASIIHEAGGGDVDELGYALAAGVHHLRTLVEQGLDVDAAARQLEFRYAATPDQFATIAKLRAARRLWHRAAEVAGATDTRQRQHAVTSRAATARYDIWVNVLRSTVGCFGAGVGGADAVTVTPHDQLLVAGGSPAGRRLARNTQLVLLEESNLGRVSDIAGGSWYVEQLTEQMAQAAWTWFQEVEGVGGVVEALRVGLVQRRVARARDARWEAIDHGRHQLTGVTEFPAIDEVPPPAEEPEPTPPPGPIEPLRPIRYSAPFEAQRGRADRIAASTARPEVFMATIGAAAAHGPRLAFATGVFEAGGIRAVTWDESTEAVADAFRASGAPLACVCASDDGYAELGADVVARLAAASPRRLFVAGRPKGLADELLAAGADELVASGDDRLAVVRRGLDAIEGA